jgi:NodT family efflux transporter outer membrane factor (OMF) lipoprotein
MAFHRFFRHHFHLLLIIAALGLSGCQSYNIKNAVQPDVSIPAQYAEHSTESAAAEMLPPWWLEFERPALNQLIEQALTDNFDLRQAVARVRQAQALAAQTGSGRLPQLSLRGAASKDWEGGDPQRGEAEIGAALQWEVDAFNRIGAAARADSFVAQAIREDLAALRLTLSAEVANAYFGAVAVVRRLELLNQQLQSDKELLELLQLRMEHGVGTKVAVLQQQSRVADSESLLPNAEAALRVFENRLDVLLGELPDTQYRVPLTESLAFSAELPTLGVPAELLLRRPDLRALQAELIAADADIAAAIADRLPRLTLNGSLVLQDQASFSGPVSMLMASFVQPLLDWGRRKAKVERSRAVYEERLAQFTQLYLRAVEEVENSLYQEARQRQTLSRLEKQRQILQQTIDETEARYLQGVDDYLPVLSALQELREIERDLITERLNLVQLRISLHRAVGGSLSFVQTENAL